jgi:hypothetical protein
MVQYLPGTKCERIKPLDASNRSDAAPAVFRIAREIAPEVSSFVWAIGGTTLLFRLGMTTVLPRDLDTFTTPEDFPRVAETIARRYGSGVRPASKNYVSEHFLTFTTDDGTQIDLMAGAAVMRAGNRFAWNFDPTRIDVIDGLPWMKLEDWQTLYALFDRPHRVAQIEEYLRRKTANF